MYLEGIGIQPGNSHPHSGSFTAVQSFELHAAFAPSRYPSRKSLILVPAENRHYCNIGPGSRRILCMYSRRSLC